MAILEKLYSVLIWKFGAKDALAILRDFSPCLGKDGGILTLEEIRKAK